MKVNIGDYPEKGERVVEVEISDHDVWNLDNTLAFIIAPALKKLKETKLGSPYVDDEDVPESLRKTASAPVDEYEVDDNHHARWEYVLNEMVFAFETYNTDWEDQFWIVDPKLDFSEYPADEGKEFKPIRWKVEGECDWEGREQMQKRIANGTRLFGKYYHGLWN